MDDRRLRPSSYDDLFMDSTYRVEQDHVRGQRSTRSVGSGRVAGASVESAAGMSPGSRQRRRMTEDVAEQVADAMFALSTPSRVQILGFLLAGPKTVSDLMDALDMEQSAVSHQLRVLREHRLVIAERDGRTRVYALYDEDVAALVEVAVRHVERRARAGQRLAGRLKRRSSA